MSKLWVRVHHRDKRAVEMADRHYSRQTPGSPEFTRPGNKIVLLHFKDGVPVALWASQRPDPTSGIKRADGLDAWDCSMYRNEGASVPSSELIREAIAITRGIWNDVEPSDGFVTTVNQKHVPATRRRGKDVWGYCFLKAGFIDRGLTKTRKLVLLQMPAEALQQITPIICKEEGMSKQATERQRPLSNRERVLGYLGQELERLQKKRLDTITIYNRLKNQCPLDSSYWRKFWKMSLEDRLFPGAKEHRQRQHVNKLAAKAKAKELIEASKPKNLFLLELKYAEPNPFQLPAKETADV